MTKKSNQNEPPVAGDEGPDPAPSGIESTPQAEARGATDPALAETLERQNRQIEELGRLTAGLAELVADAQAQSQRDAAFLSAVESVRSASAAVTAATAMREAPAIAAPNALVAAPAGAATVSPHGVENNDCGGGLCECTAPQCCCFQIWMKSVRVLAMQPLELEDSNVLNPWAELEVQMFAFLDGGIGAVIPSLFSFITLGKLVQHPGAKVSIERPIGTVCLRKGKTRRVTVTVDAIESDKGLLERLTGGRDEEGSNSGTMLLDCCCSVEPTLTFDVQFTSGGQGGGAIEVEFVARRTC